MAAAVTKQTVSTANGDFNALTFLVNQMLGRINTATLVRVEAVYSEGVEATGLVDVTPLVNQVDNAGNNVPNATIFGVPFMRIQGGLNAVVVDPQVGDIGFCIFADSDISTVKATSQPAPPSSDRTFSMSDALYVGGWNNVQAPQRYIRVSDDGIAIEADTAALKINAASLEATIPGPCEITVPELTINGNLHVTGLVHCTWEGENIGVGFGGTGADLSETGGPNMVVAQLTPGGAFSVVPISSVGTASTVTLGETFATNQPYKLVSGVARKITSLDPDFPYIDGLTLGSGHAGDVVRNLNSQTSTAHTPLPPPGVNDSTLYLDRNGRLTAIKPTIEAGHIWFVPIARRISSSIILYTPEIPIRLAP